MCKYVYVYICIYLYVYTLTQSHSQTLSSPYVLPSEEEPQTVSFLWIDTQQAKTNGCHSIWAGRNKPYIVINLQCSCVCSWKTQVFVMFFCACLPSRTLPVDYVHFFKRELFWPLRGKRNTVKSRVLFIQTRLSVGLAPLESLRPQGYTTLFGASGCNGAWSTRGSWRVSPVIWATTMTGDGRNPIKMPMTCWMVYELRWNSHWEIGNTLEPLKTKTFRSPQKPVFLVFHPSASRWCPGILGTRHCRHYLNQFDRRDAEEILTWPPLLGWLGMTDDRQGIPLGKWLIASYCNYPWISPLMMMGL